MRSPTVAGEQGRGRSEAVCGFYSATQDLQEDWPNAPPVEKGIDVQLAVDVVQLVLQDEYSAAIIVSHDGDLLSAVESVMKLKAAHWAHTPCAHVVKRTALETMILPSRCQRQRRSCCWRRVKRVRKSVISGVELGQGWRVRAQQD